MSNITGMSSSNMPGGRGNVSHGDFLISNLNNNAFKLLINYNLRVDLPNMWNWTEKSKMPVQRQHMSNFGLSMLNCHHDVSNPRAIDGFCCDSDTADSHGSNGAANLLTHQMYPVFFLQCLFYLN